MENIFNHIDELSVNVPIGETQFRFWGKLVVPKKLNVEVRLSTSGMGDHCINAQLDPGINFFTGLPISSAEYHCCELLLKKLENHIRNKKLSKRNVALGIGKHSPASFILESNTMIHDLSCKIKINVIVEI